MKPGACSINGLSATMAWSYPCWVCPGMIAVISTGILTPQGIFLSHAGTERTKHGAGGATAVHAGILDDPCDAAVGVANPNNPADRGGRSGGGAGARPVDNRVAARACSRKAAS